jgi:iron complex outermembrane receptor protein
MSPRTSRLLVSTLLAATSLFALSPVAALAQATQTPAAAPSGAVDVDELVVTGSRIRRNEYTSSSPVSVITSEQATLQGLVDTATLLQTAPVASGSFQTNGLLSNFVTTGGPGVATVSLRGLGATRTLVLLDGRRLGPAGVRGSVGPVDLNVIPESIVDRTEILKDGASSIYGSDAVAGVVNFITNAKLEGGKLSAYASLPERRGGRQFEYNGSWGKSFERGHINLAFDYSKQGELRNGDRKYLNCTQDQVLDPTSRARLDFTDATTGRYKCFNVLTGVAQAAAVYGGSFQYAQPGITYPGAGQGNNIAGTFPGLAAMGFVRAGRAGQPATYPYLNEDSPLYARTTAITPYERYTLYGSGTFDLTPGIELYGDLLLNRRVSRQHGYQQLFPTVAADNPNNPFTDVNGVQFDALPVVAFQEDSGQKVNYVRAVGGARGKFGDLPVIGGWNWDIYAQYSKSDADYRTDFLYNDRLNAVTGSAACDPSQITISPQAACISIPFFSQRFLAGQFTDQEKAFLFGVAQGNTQYTQAAAEGTITGELFDLPAGPLGVALGFAVRKDKIDDEPDAQETAGNLYNLTAATPTKGEDTVKEVFLELNVPALKDTVVGDLDFTLSGRRTHYDSYGSNSTYKVGFDWQPLHQLRFRGTYGTSFRAPALYELYIGDQTSFLDQTQVDPCVRYEDSSNATLRQNCAASGVPIGYTGGGSGITISTGGGAGRLKAETSKAGTIGVVWTPSFEGFAFSVAVDYFDIRVDNEVRSFGAANIVKQCYLSPNFPTDPLCSLFVRDTTTDPANPGIVTVNDNYVNVAKQQNRGIDLNVHYRQEFQFATLSMDVQATWQLEDTTQLLGESDPEDFNGSTTEPDFTAQVQFRADRGPWTAFWTVDMFGKTSDSDLFDFDFTDVHASSRYNQDVYYKQYTEFTAYHNLTLRRKFDDWTVQAGARNLFNQPPPVLSGNEGFRTGYAALNAYDLLGRRFFFQVERKF